nr:MAG TPA: hypothetical protein [Caudoviricetes sp.]
MVGVLTIGVTVTAQVAVLPFVVLAVIVADPDFKPVIRPSLETLAIVAALEVQVIVLSVAFVGSKVTDNWKVDPFAIDLVEALRVIELTAIDPVVNSTAVHFADSSSPSVSDTWNVYFVFGVKPVIVAVSSDTSFRNVPFR